MFDIGNHIRYGVELERAQMPNNGLNESPGLMNSILGTLTGATQEGVDNKRAAVQGKADQREYGSLYESETGKQWKPGMTGGAALAEIREAKTGRQDARDNTAFERSLKPIQMQMEQQDKRYAYQDTQNRLDRAHERQLSDNNTDLQREIALMDSELADKRMAYDRETRRMDKRDRMIAQLMAGIGQLGGAFAL